MSELRDRIAEAAEQAERNTTERKLRRQELDAQTLVKLIADHYKTSVDPSDVTHRDIAVRDGRLKTDRPVVTLEPGITVAVVQDYSGFSPGGRPVLHAEARDGSWWPAESLAALARVLNREPSRRSTAEPEQAVAESGDIDPRDPAAVAVALLRIATALEAQVTSASAPLGEPPRGSRNDDRDAGDAESHGKQGSR